MFLRKPELHTSSPDVSAEQTAAVTHEHINSLTAGLTQPHLFQP